MNQSKIEHIEAIPLYRRECLTSFQIQEFIQFLNKSITSFDSDVLKPVLLKIINQIQDYKLLQFSIEEKKELAVYATNEQKVFLFRFLRSYLFENLYKLSKERDYYLEYAALIAKINDRIVIAKDFDLNVFSAKESVCLSKLKSVDENIENKHFTYYFYGGLPFLSNYSIKSLLEEFLIDSNNSLDKKKRSISIIRDFISKSYQPIIDDSFLSPVEKLIPEINAYNENQSKEIDEVLRTLNNFENKLTSSVPNLSLNQIESLNTSIKDESFDKCHSVLNKIGFIDYLNKEGYNQKQIKSIIGTIGRINLSKFGLYTYLFIKGTTYYVFCHDIGLIGVLDEYYQFNSQLISEELAKMANNGSELAAFKATNLKRNYSTPINHFKGKYFPFKEVNIELSKNVINRIKSQ